MEHIQQYSHDLNQLVSTVAGLKISYQHLIELRKLVFSSELSQNPLGRLWNLDLELFFL